MNLKQRLWLVLAGAMVLASCGNRCRVSSQCDPGEHCDFTIEMCVMGCGSNADCAPGRCDISSGRCIPIQIMVPDIGTSSTATTADAGA